MDHSTVAAQLIFYLSSALIDFATRQLPAAMLLHPF
jgi:hypothetical protein